VVDETFAFDDSIQIEEIIQNAEFDEGPKAKKPKLDEEFEGFDLFAAEQELLSLTSNVEP
jgi:hypothetical protein